MVGSPAGKQVDVVVEGSQRLDLTDLSGAIDEFPTLLDRLGSLREGEGFIEIALPEFMYSSALAVIAQWILARGYVNRHRFINTVPSMKRYLTSIRFQDALMDPGIVVSPDPMDWAVGLTRINRELPTERVTDKIVDILTTFTNPNAEDRSSLYVLISEMIENVHRHAQAPADGFAVAQVYPQHLKMGIALVDAGIGVRQSFADGEPSIPIKGLKSDEEFLRVALQLHATSKSTRHSGYGLFLLSEVISRNRGTFLVTSGNATLIGYRRAGRLHLDSFTHRPWQGTIVSVIINLTRDLPLNQVYREMPLPEGMTDDDFFE
jgi:hypothetical protein